MRYFDPATKGFYDDRIHKEIPPGAHPLTTLEYDALLAAQSVGQVIVADADGRPQAIAAAAPGAAERLAALRHRRDAALRQSDKTQLSDFPISKADRQALALWRQQLRDLPEQGADAAIPDPPVSF